MDRIELFIESGEVMWLAGQSEQCWAPTDCDVQENREIVAEALEFEEYEPEACIFSRGEMGDKFYLIKEGAVILTNGLEGSAKIAEKRGPKAYFGERALIRAEKRWFEPVNL